MAEGTTAEAGGAPGAGEANPEAGGGRWVDVAPERLARWVATFAERHGAITVEPGRLAVTFRAADGAAAECHPPFPPLPAPAGGTWPGDPVEVAGLIAAHAAVDRTVGVFLVRLGGFAAGVFTGSPPRLVSSKVGSRLVHGRSAAGGTSQHRFARRRENQATAAVGAAADTAAKVLVPYAERLDAVVLGGDRKAISGARADPRLRPVMRHAVDRFLTVPDPRLAVLRDSPRLFLAVRIHLTGPA
ncbi:MAG TPA: acVLRF1 family peptidyl-tRNA hydrolase [Streptosporangiaceae bacterium]|nr:acVLRF1 family peptidyl-tRNA hydrolase [Streptosporangiaceae bacterium]